MKNNNTTILLTPLTGFALDNKIWRTLFFRYSSQAIESGKQALEIAERTQREKQANPLHSSDGSVSFIYGSGQIQGVCAPLQVCDIALQAR